MFELHFLQLKILKKLLFSQGLSFSELRPDNSVENNLLDFHLKQLLGYELISKEDKLYRLTTKGKEFANRMTTEKTEIKTQGKIGAIVCCYRNIGDELEFLIQRRLKHPFFGATGYMSGKIEFGETVQEAARRELKEETNLDGDPELFMIQHRLVYEASNPKKLLEDKYFYFHRVANPEGELEPNEEGEVNWVAYSELENYFENAFDTVEEMMQLTNEIVDIKAPLLFKEIKNYTDKF